MPLLAYGPDVECTIPGLQDVVCWRVTSDENGLVIEAFHDEMADEPLRVVLPAETIAEPSTARAA